MDTAPNFCTDAESQLHSIYIHIPFCRKRCSYCDFNTVAGQERLIPLYVEALCSEIVKTMATNHPPIHAHTIFFGGGTPTLLSTPQIGQILTTIQQTFLLQPDMEITIEGNPGTVTQEQLSAFHTLGVNRLSFGVQSVHAHELAMLGRIHNHEQARHSIIAANNAGFNNINLDLIFGLPNQTLSDWQETVRTIIDFAPTHLSLYALKLEDNTPIAKLVDENVLPEPDADLAADMYEWAMEHLPSAGYAQYEISNWTLVDAQGNYRSKHNLQYWHNLPYFGFGAGAHGLINESRLVNVYDPAQYIESCLHSSPIDFPISPATIEVNPRSLNDQMDEHMILGLRLTDEGVNRSDFVNLYHTDFTVRYAKQINTLLHQGLLEWHPSNEAIRLTKRGRLLGNQVFYQFLSD